MSNLDDLAAEVQPRERRTTPPLPTEYERRPGSSGISRPVVGIKCYRCNGVVVPKTSRPTWAIVLGICTAPVGLLFLLVKETKCPRCGGKM